MADPLSFRIKKQFDRYVHDPIAAMLAIPLFLILKFLPFRISSYLCGILIYLIAPITSYNSRVKKHMKIAFPQKPKKELVIDSLKIQVREITDEDIKNRNLPNQTKGLVITKIENNSPLLNTIEINSIILEAQKKKITKIDDLEQTVSKVLKSNQKTILLVIYNSQNQRRYIGIKLN